MVRQAKMVESHRVPQSWRPVTSLPAHPSVSLFVTSEINAKLPTDVTS